jgi:hypothetical protein
MNLTLTQKIALLMITLNALAGGTAQLTPLFGQQIATLIVSAAALANTIIGGWVFVLTGQQNIVKQVADMAGVERISVNENANQALAQVAVDPNQPKVGATAPAVRQVLQTTAVGGNP